MAAAAQIQYTITMPAIQLPALKTISKAFNWVLTPVKQTTKTSFQKSQDDIKAGRITTYKSTDDFFKKVLL